MSHHQRATIHNPPTPKPTDRCGGDERTKKRKDGIIHNNKKRKKVLLSLSLGLPRVVFSILFLILFFNFYKHYRIPPPTHTLSLGSPRVILSILFLSFFFNFYKHYAESPTCNIIITCLSMVTYLFTYY